MGNAKVRQRSEETRGLVIEAQRLEGEAEALLTQDTGAAQVLFGSNSGRLDRLARLKSAAGSCGNRKVTIAAYLIVRKIYALYWRVAAMWEPVASAAVRRLAPHFEAEADPHDVMQLARIGLFEAAKRFDPDRGIVFATYAKWWVQAVITRRARSGDVSGLAIETFRNLRKLESAGVSGDAALAERLGISVARVRELRVIFLRPVSLDAPAAGAGEDGPSLEEILSSGGDEIRDERPDAHSIEAALDWIPERHREVIQRRFGLGGREAATLAVVGEALSMSRERVRQIEREALDMLRDKLGLDDNETGVRRTITKLLRHCGEDGLTPRRAWSLAGVPLDVAQRELESLVADGLASSDGRLAGRRTYYQRSEARGQRAGAPRVGRGTAAAQISRNRAPEPTPAPISAARETEGSSGPEIGTSPG